MSENGECAALGERGGQADTGLPGGGEGRAATGLVDGRFWGGKVGIESIGLPGMRPVGNKGRVSGAPDSKAEREQERFI